MHKITLTLGLLTALFSHAAMAAFKLPAYETYQLENGLTVYLMPQHEVPMLDVRLTVRAGAVDDQQQFGLANLTVESLKFGSGKLDKKSIEDRLAFLGANFDVRAETEMTSLSLSLAAKDQQELLALFRDIALKPQFDKAEFEKFKQRFISQLEQSRESPRNVIGSLFNRMYYGAHPYGNPVLGDESSIKQLDINRVKSFYAQYYTPANSALILVGDFKPAEMKAQISELFSSWQGKPAIKAAQSSQSLQSPLASVSDKTAPAVWLVNKEDATETTFLIGGKGIKANHKDFVAAQVLNTILGGRFTSWLNDELRVNSGLTYGARSQFADQASAGSFAMSTFTKTETTNEAIALALKTYNKLWEKGIDKQTLDSAKAYVKGQFPPDFETSEQLAQFLGRMWALNLNESLINDFEAQVDSLNVAKANALVDELFPRNNLQFVLVGKASAIKEAVKQYGEIKEMDIKTFTF